MKTTTDNDEIAFHAIQGGHFWQLAPARKSESTKERQTWLIVAKDKSQQGINLNVMRLSYRLHQKIGSQPFFPMIFVDVDT